MFRKKKEEALDEKSFDVETSNSRELDANFLKITYFIGVLMSVWQLWTLFIKPMDPFLVRSVHVSVLAMLGFLYMKGYKSASNTKPSIIDWLLFLAALGIIVYVIYDYENIVIRSGVNPNLPDVIFGTLLIIVIIELSRRTSGLALPIIAFVFLAYALWGSNLPGLFSHPAYSYKRIISFLFGVQGIYSEPVGVSSTFVFMFILFGTLLNNSGGGEAIIDFSTAIAGGMRGGPAKVSILSSSLFGAISGSAVANVTVTGTFTIPLMKKTGYRPEFAGAVEAVSSTGGQITPPVLGAAAFLIAEVLSVNYSTIVLATIIPALMYYISLFAMVDFEAGKNGLLGIPKDQLPTINEVRKKHGLLLLPILVLLFFLTVVGFSPLKSAAYSAISIIVFGAVKKSTRDRVMPKQILKSLALAPKDLISVASTCATAGIVVGVMSLTGLGHRFSVLLVELSGGNLAIALILTMIVSIILGMGVPPVAAYAIAGSAIGPSLINLGVPAMAAHLFIFYFCAISVITPPVALASYAAAALAKADMWKVGLTAFRIGLVAFLIPYMFVYNQALLMQGPALGILQAFATGITGCICLAAGMQGWVGKTIKMPFRILLLVIAFVLVIPETITDIIGIVGIVFFLVMYKSGVAIKKDEEVNL
ncbi:TRAP transporter permease [Peptoniphilus catoniae]|uniref:TRAP transporter permease n=1 Tax=Peptoniphilus catoniae TaxID=1660341 RepID=UPI0010FD3A1F|nr:TRAP transporter permease [Peptoniphilus catoniae]